MTRTGNSTDIKADLWPEFRAQIPQLLQSQDRSSGRFGSPPFVVTDQNAVWALAVAWGYERADNPYFHDADLLAAIISGGDALIAAQDERGMFEFRKKDNSTWGQIYMPWTYSRWIRAWAAVRDAMPPADRQRWDDAITLGVQGMVDTALTDPVRNIPAHDAMAIYCASRVLARDDWEATAVDYLHRTVDAQDRNGYWSEHLGPVVNYNFVYVDLLGVYYGMSRDRYVRPALERAATFHATFSYPDGSSVETVDERNSYARHSVAGGVGFMFSPHGREYFARLLRIRRAQKIPPAADMIASVLAYGEDGPATPAFGAGESHRAVLGDNDAMTLSEDPWFACLSAFCGAPGDTRWIQDRQSFLSIYHEDTGLILTGGNTKLQPLWSTFTAGDTSLLAHTPGDEDPDFVAPAGLVHVPSQVTLDPDETALSLTYGDAACVCRLELSDPNTAVVSYQLVSSSVLPIEAHAAFLPHLGEKWRTATDSGALGDEPFTLTAEQCGGRFEHHGWRVTLPPRATVDWPVVPHNPYAKDGSGLLADARIVVTLPLGTTPARKVLRIDVPPTP